MNHDNPPPPPTTPHHRPSTLITISTCNLNQWSLDFTTNLHRTLLSCQIAKSQNSQYRLGPELELCGYGCEDHFLEMDTFHHCWESLLELFQKGATDDLLCDFGMPVLHRGVRYNCRVLCKDRRVLLIRPKSVMADGGNYRESRYFTAYVGGDVVEEHLLPRELFGEVQRTAPFGLMSLEFGDGVRVGCESCEELWSPMSSHLDMSLRGVDIIGNGSGSHHELRKLNARLELMVSATRKCGGVYLYSNQRGCDGGRLYYDGCAMIVCNGKILAQADQFSLEDVQVVTATVDLDDVRSYRASIPAFGVQAARLPKANHFVDCENVYFRSDDAEGAVVSPTIGFTKPRLHTPEEECCLGPACWLWDFLRRSGANGFFLPLSGGADSSAVATIVGAMCVLVTTTITLSSPQSQVLTDLRRITNHPDPNWIPSSPQEVAQQLFHTCFMGTSNSSQATTDRAKRLAESIGAFHLSINIDVLIRAALKIFSIATAGKFTPVFQSEGGTPTQDVALQNIQARMRMVMSYMFAQLLPWTRSKPGFLLVLGSANVDEALRGYVTKYDCSSADLNPIGAISKGDLKKMILWASEKYGWRVLEEVANAKPTAELRPIALQAGEDVSGTAAAVAAAAGEHTQTDEEDMGMTYEELGVFGRLRKIERCGPVTMLQKLFHLWSHLTPQEVCTKIKRFFYYYSVNRHKMCTITPAYHAEAYSPDDNRFDLRQFLYNTKWTRQFQVMDEMVEKWSEKVEQEEEHEKHE